MRRERERLIIEPVEPKSLLGQVREVLDNWEGEALAEAVGLRPSGA